MWNRPLRTIDSFSRSRWAIRLEEDRYHLDSLRGPNSTRLHVRNFSSLGAQVFFLLVARHCEGLKDEGPVLVKWLLASENLRTSSECDLQGDPADGWNQPGED